MISSLESSLEQKYSELKQAIENLQDTKAKHVESISELTNEVDTLKLEIKRQKLNIQINETRLANKDDELIKTHAVINTLNQNVLFGEVKESELKQAIL